MNFISDYLGSSFFYFLLLIFSVLFAFLAQIVKSKRAGNVFVTIVILILALPAGLRDASVGIDTSNYLLIIRSSSPNYIGELFYSYYELGFQWLLIALMFLFDDPHYVILIISLITNMLIIRTLWHFKDKISFSLSVFLYFCMHYFAIYNISRQWLAIAIVFFAIRYLFESKYIKYFIFVVIATLLHGSAIISLIFIPFHMLIVNKIALKYKFLMVISTIVFLLFYDNILNLLGITSSIEKFQYYMQASNETLGIGFLFVIRLLAIFTAIWLLIYKRYEFQDNHFIKTIIIINLFGVTSMLLGNLLFTFAVRIGAYATVFDIILFSMMTRTRPFSIFIKIAFVLLGIYLFFSGISISSHGQMPYKVFFTD